jgi:uncharacterized repeat protein (TIGR03837 family)
MSAPPPWDLFCRVVDNHGDIGVCWRLAADLAARGQPVRLRVDDGRALAWMAPLGAPGVTVLPFTSEHKPLEPGAVVIEAFGCDPPEAFVARMATRRRPPLWINLEYLSAEDYVQRCHRLRSPQLAGPGRGLDKWFFYPGFVVGTGGLIRECGVAGLREAFDATAWLHERGCAPHPGERVISLFCYPQAPVAELLRSLPPEPTLLLAAPGAAQDALRQGGPLRPTQRWLPLPWLTQSDYDRLLWASDLNFVRGEDSLVRALWAGAPFVWQVYPQHDGAHRHKLLAFLDLFLDGADDALAADVRALCLAWSGLGPWPSRWPDARRWGEQARRFRAGLRTQPDLASSLLGFVRERS